MKKHIFAVGLLFALAGCDIGGIRGNGHLVSEQRNVGPFVNVETGGAFRVEWNRGAPSASITVDENLMQYVEMEVRDKVLHVRTTRSVRPTHSIRLALTSSALEGASFSGACERTGVRSRLRSPIKIDNVSAIRAAPSGHS